MNTHQRILLSMLLFLIGSVVILSNTGPLWLLLAVLLTVLCAFFMACYSDTENEERARRKEIEKILKEIEAERQNNPTVAEMEAKRRKQ